MRGLSSFSIIKGHVMPFRTQLILKNLALSVIISATPSLAAEEILESGRKYVVSKTHILLPVNQLGTVVPERQLGSFFIVRKTDLGPAELAEKTLNSALTLMEAGPDSYAISDATVVIVTQDRATLSEVFLDYGLTMRHEFSATFGGVAQLATVSDAEGIIERLKVDSRIKAVQLNLQTFDDQPQ